jgi:hypothetical protein
MLLVVLPSLTFPDRRPVGPDAGEAGEGAALVERELDVAALDLVELAEGVERDHAAGVPLASLVATKQDPLADARSPPTVGAERDEAELACFC